MQKWPRWAKRVWVITLLLAVLGAVNLGFLYLLKSTETVPAHGGTYYEAMVSRVQNLNPYYCYMSAIDRDLCSLLYTGLTKYDPVSKEILGDLAYTWTISEDGLEYTFLLREDIFWHDGAPITADDVIFSYNDILKSPDYMGSYQMSFYNVEMSAPDTKTVVFKLQEPQSFFPYTVTLGVLPKHLLGDVPISNLEGHSFNRNPIGSGPFKIFNIETEKDVDIVELKANEYYYGEKPYIQSLVLYGFSQTSDLLHKQSVFDGIRDNASVDYIDPDRFNKHTIQLPRVTGVFFNINNSILKTLNVRKALKISLDKSSLVSGLTNVESINSPLPFIDSGIATTQDLEKAKELLYGADWKIFSEEYSDGIRRDKNGDKLSLILATTKSTDNIEVAEKLKEAWLQIGVDVEIVSLEIGDLQENIIKPRKYDILLIAEELQENIDLYPYFHSSQMIDPGLNLSQYKNIGADLLMDTIRSTNDYASQVEKTKTLLRLLDSDVPCIYLYSQKVPYFVSKEIINVKIPPQAGNISDRFNLFHTWAKDVTHVWK